MYVCVLENKIHIISYHTGFELNIPQFKQLLNYMLT